MSQSYPQRSHGGQRAGWPQDIGDVVAAGNGIKIGRRRRWPQEYVQAMYRTKVFRVQGSFSAGTLGTVDELIHAGQSISITTEYDTEEDAYETIRDEGDYEEDRADWLASTRGVGVAFVLEMDLRNASDRFELLLSLSIPRRSVVEWDDDGTVHYDQRYLTLTARAIHTDYDDSEQSGRLLVTTDGTTQAGTIFGTPVYRRDEPVFGQLTGTFSVTTDEKW